MIEKYLMIFVINVFIYLVGMIMIESIGISINSTIFENIGNIWFDIILVMIFYISWYSTKRILS
jgi:hypothetical protein